MLLKESTVQSKKRGAAAIGFYRYTRTVEAFEDNVSATDRVPTQVRGVWSRVFMSSGLWKDDKLQENVR